MKTQRWLACRKVFVPSEMPHWWYHLSAFLFGVGLGILTVWLAGCAARRKPELTGTLGPIDVWDRDNNTSQSAIATGKHMRKCVRNACVNATWERRPDVAPLDYPNRGMWQCPKDYWLAFEGREAKLSEVYDHNAETYCVTSNPPKCPEQR